MSITVFKAILLLFLIFLAVAPTNNRDRDNYHMPREQAKGKFDRNPKSDNPEEEITFQGQSPYVRDLNEFAHTPELPELKNKKKTGTSRSPRPHR